MGKTYKMLAAIAIALPLAAGCGPSSEEKALQEAADSMAGARARGETDLSNPEMGAKMSVVLTDGGMTQSHQELPKGQVSIVIENKGTEARIFEVKGPNLDMKSLPIPPGAHMVMSQVFDAGAFDMMCPDSTGENKRCGTGKLTVR